MMNYEAPDFLARQLPEPVRQICLDLVVDADDAGGAASSTAAQRVDRFEVSLRTVALRRLSSSSASSSSSNNNNENENNNDNSRVQALVELWQQAARAVCHVLHFAERHPQQQPSPSSAGAATADATSQQQLQQLQPNYTSLRGAASQLRKLPIVLLEDILDALNLADGYTFWKACCRSSFSSSNDNDNDSLLFGPVLWKNSSSSKQPPTWLPFLKCANKFLRRLQARQSLPITGGDRDSSDVAASAAAADVLQVLSRVYPMSEKSACRVWGSHNADHVAVLEAPPPPEAATANSSETAAAAAEKSASRAAAVATTNSTAAVDDDDDDGGLYETFWRLQQDFRNPNGVVVADFLRRLAVVLRTFRNLPPATAAAAAGTTATHTTAATDGSSGNSALWVLAQPYLTHRRLLPVQLRDPALRAAILVQFGIAAHHLVAQVPQLRPQLQPHLDDAQQLLFPGDGNGSNDDTDKTNAHRQQQLRNILERSEPQWRTWKQNKCQPDLEPPRRKQTAATGKRKANGSNIISTAADAPASKRRKRSHHRRAGSRSTTANKTDDEEKVYEWSADDGNLSHLQSVAQTLRAPSAADHLEAYVEALDPDAGIEAEYHPKNDALYSWRALRLLAATNLRDFAAGLHPSGDYEGLVRTAHRRDLGAELAGTGPAPYAGEPDSSSSGDEQEQQEPEAPQGGQGEEEPAPINGTAGAEEGDAAATMQEEDEEVDFDIGEKDHGDDAAAAAADVTEEPTTAPENVVGENGFVDGTADAMDIERKSQDETSKEPAMEARNRDEDRTERSSDRTGEAHPDKKRATTQQNGEAHMSPGGDEKMMGNGGNSRSPSSSRNQQPRQQPSDGGRKPLNRSEGGGYQQRGPRPGNNGHRPPHSSDHRRDYRPQDDGHYRGGRNVDHRGGDRGGAAAAAGPPPVGGLRPDDRLYRDRDGSGAPGRGGGGRGGGHRRDYGRRDDSRGRRGGRGDRSRR